MSESQSELVLDLARMLIELDDEELTTKNLTACIYAMSVKSGLSPGQFLVDISEDLPDYEEWFEEYLPKIVETPDDYESVADDS